MFSGTIELRGIFIDSSLAKGFGAKIVDSGAGFQHRGV